MLSLRLPYLLENRLNRYSKMKKQSKSQVVKQALEQFLKTDTTEPTLYDIGKDYFGKYSLGEPDLSKNYKAKLKAKLNEKHNR